MTPEHKVRNKGYCLQVEVNEKEGKVVSVNCDDCPASEGAFLSIGHLFHRIYCPQNVPSA